jgi:predicted MPP superfamily phosphohydrolase
MDMNIKKKIGFAFFAFTAIAVAYNVYDNNRIIVKEQIVYIDNLPQEFENFKILQITDLHGKYFGKDQSLLIGQVNSIKYDMIAFTGDMAAKSATDFTAFIELLKGINNKEYMFYVNGNDDTAYSSLSGDSNASGRSLEQHGCILLTEPYPIKKGDKTIWISNYFSGNQDECASSHSYHGELEKEFEELKNNRDIKIMLTHIPYTASDFENIDKNSIPDYSLIIAGHYHGGQFRIPFYGALYIPVSTSEDGIWFPRQEDVIGLSDDIGIQQYISAGLGASIIPFRVFDTPEINLIILRKK